MKHEQWIEVDSWLDVHSAARAMYMWQGTRARLKITEYDKG